jgi:hypothetical protein
MSEVRPPWDSSLGGLSRFSLPCPIYPTYPVASITLLFYAMGGGVETLGNYPIGNLMRNVMSVTDYRCFTYAFVMFRWEA